MQYMEHTGFSYGVISYSRWNTYTKLRKWTEYDVASSQTPPPTIIDLRSDVKSAYRDMCQVH